MLIDLHVHSSRYSACGISAPEEMVARAIEVGLQGLVFTEHHVVWPARELANLQERFPAIKLFRGVEVTSVDGDDYLVYGVTEPDIFRAQMDVSELLGRARARGGTVVLAHPYRFKSEVPAILEEMRVDGLEVGSNNMTNYGHTMALKLVDRWNIPAVTASDAHQVDALGLYAVRFQRAIVDETDLARALKGREFDLFADTARLTARNDEMLAQIPKVLELIAAGYNNSQVHQEFPSLNLSAVEGIRRGWDVRKPTSPQVAHLKRYDGRP